MHNPNLSESETIQGVIMKMNTIIAINGKENTGKTTTIKEINQLLKSEYPTSKREYEIHKPDIRVIITINGVKIGIESQGDPGRLPKSILLFVENQCDIIVCATRSKGQTIKLIKKQENYEIIWHCRLRTKVLEHQRESVEDMAGIIKKKIVALINNA